MFFIIRNISKLKDNINRVFLLISIPLGLLYVIMIPVFAGTDEPFHFFRAYQISQGTITVDNENYNTQIPKSLLNLQLFLKYKLQFFIKIYILHQLQNSPIF